MPTIAAVGRELLPLVALLEAGVRKRAMMGAPTGSAGGAASAARQDPNERLDGRQRESCATFMMCGFGNGDVLETFSSSSVVVPVASSLSLSLSVSRSLGVMCSGVLLPLL